MTKYICNKENVFTVKKKKKKSHEIMYKREKDVNDKVLKRGFNR